MAVGGNGEIGRYQIGAWATQGAGAIASHTGYYILDTATGKVPAIAHTGDKSLFLGVLSQFFLGSCPDILL
jgi:hypothetical protein